MLVEGAGSASEVNLRADDIANMGFARAADVPGRAHRRHRPRRRDRQPRRHQGACSTRDDAAMIAGFIVNKFRGDPALFADGMATIAAAHRLARARPRAVSSPTRTGCRPRTRSALDRARRGREAGARVRIAVPILPHIANFDDLDPLRPSPTSSSCVVRPGRAVPGRRRPRHPARLEGDDRRSRGAARSRLGHRHRGASCAAAATCSASAAATRCSAARSPIPTASKGRPATVDGPRPARRRDGADRRQDAASRSTGDDRRDGVPFTGYEMHMGATDGPGLRAAVRASRRRPRRTARSSADGRVAGSYVHGLFADDRQRARTGWRGSARRRRRSTTRPASRRRSTRSPRISRRIVDLDRLLSARAMTASASERRPARPAIAVGARDRARARARMSAAVGLAPPPSPISGIVDQHAAVDARPGEREAERAGHRRLRPAGVGRAVTAARRAAPLARRSRGEAPGMSRPRQRRAAAPQAATPAG